MERELCRCIFLYTQSCVEQAALGRLTTLKSVYDKWEFEECILAAAEAGHVHILRYLWSQAEDEFDEDLKHEVLIEAAAYGHLGVIQFVLELGADIHDNDEEVLYVAAVNGHLNVVQFIIAGGACACEWRVPIVEAVWARQFEVVMFLCETTGGRLDSTENPEWTPLNCAVEAEHTDLVHSLLDRGYTWGAKYALRSAAERGLRDVVERLVNHKEITEEDRAKALLVTDDPWIQACLSPR